MTFIFISLFTLLTYIIFTLLYVGATPSLSETFYKLKDKHVFPYLFTITLWIAAFTLIPVFIDNTPDTYQFLPFFTCAGICFIGASPFFKEGSDRYVHIGGLICSCVTLSIWVLLIGLFNLSMIALASAFIGYIIMYAITKKSYPLYWLEMFSFITAYLCNIYLLF